MPLALAACGFRPAYGPTGAASGIYGQLRATDPVDKNSYDFVTAIEARLGRTKTPRFGLDYTITTEVVGAGYSTDNAITRYNLKGKAVWSLIDLAAGSKLAGGTAQNFTSWSATGATVAGLAAEQDAALRLMTILADQITAEILAASARLAP